MSATTLEETQANMSDEVVEKCAPAKRVYHAHINASITKFGHDGIRLASDGPIPGGPETFDGWNGEYCVSVQGTTKNSV